MDNVRKQVLLRFAAFHQIQHAYAKYILGTPDKPLGFGSNLLCGSFAGAIEAALVRNSKFPPSCVPFLSLQFPRHRPLMAFTSILNTFSSALLTHFCALQIVQPFERGKTLRADFHSPYRVYADSFREHGLIGCTKVIYTGFVPCLARQVCNQATGLALIYSLKNWWLSKYVSTHPHFCVSIFLAFNLQNEVMKGVFWIP